MSGHRRTPWIKWSAEQNAYDQALREGPTAALDRFSTLFSQRAPAPVTSDKDELVKLAEVLTEYFERSIETNTELWRASIDNEFVLFLTNIITATSFFDHHPDFAIYICRTLLAILKNWLAEAAIIDGAREKHRIVPSSHIDVFWGASETMWVSLWDRRSTLASRLDSRHWRTTSLALDMIAFITEALRDTFCPSTNPLPVTVQVAYLSWVYLHGSEQITKRDLAEMPSLHNAPALVFKYYMLLRKVDDDSSATPQPSLVFMEELVNAIDTRTLVRAAHNVLSYSSSLVDDRLSAYIDILAVQMPLIGLQWYASPPLAEALDASLIRQTTMHTEDPRLNPGLHARRNITPYTAVCAHFRTIIAGLAAGIIPSTAFPGHIFWNILVRGMLDIYAAETLLRHDQGHCECGDHEMLEKTQNSFLGAISALAEFLASRKHDGRLPPSVTDKMRDEGMKPRVFQVTGLWYGETETLRRFLRYGPSRATYTILLDSWMKIGDAFGIDETSQRDLEAAQRARQCSWHLCVHHSEPAEKPLLVCKGCKEARYCSATCQRSDWKEGGHRTNCRRVK